jgi:hypothetical protein
MRVNTSCLDPTKRFITTVVVTHHLGLYRRFSACKTGSKLRLKNAVATEALDIKRQSEPQLLEVPI